MKVVFLCDAPYPHEQRWVSHFVRRGYDCDVISFRPATIDGARVHHIDGREKLGKARYLTHARRIRGLVRELQPDIVHAIHLTSYGFLGALSGYRPLIVSAIGTDILEAPKLTPMHRWLTRYALSRADAITATGLHLATETTRYVEQGTPVTVVPFGIDLSRFAYAERPARDDVVFGTVARLSVEKGVRYLVEAFASVRESLGARARLRIAGDGPERADIESLVRRLGLEDSVELRGWVDAGDVPSFLHELDVFVLPSVYEGFGVAAAEAMATGLPVVASDVFGIPDVVQQGSTGLLVPAKDVSALADAMLRLANDASLRRTMGRAGHDYVASHYDWDANAAQMERLYEQVTNRTAVPA